MSEIKKNEKIAGCKPTLINQRTNAKYRLSYIDTTGAEWEFDLHTMSARERGAIQASWAVIKFDEKGKPKQITENNLELVNSATIFNALSDWNLDADKTPDNIDQLPKDVRSALLAAINEHETELNAELESEVKN